MTIILIMIIELIVIAFVLNHNWGWPVTFECYVTVLKVAFFSSPLFSRFYSFKDNILIEHPTAAF